MIETPMTQGMNQKARDGLVAAVVDALTGAPGRSGRIARLTPY